MLENHFQYDCFKINEKYFLTILYIEIMYNIFEMYPFRKIIQQIYVT